MFVGLFFIIVDYEVTDLNYFIFLSFEKLGFYLIFEVPIYKVVVLDDVVFVIVFIGVNQLRFINDVVQLIAWNLALIFFIIFLRIDRISFIFVMYGFLFVLRLIDVNMYDYEVVFFIACYIIISLNTLTYIVLIDISILFFICDTISIGVITRFERNIPVVNV